MSDSTGLVGFQQRMTWRGIKVLTLADIWPKQPKAMIVGLNPAPPSVSAGHYYQGRVGQRQMTRLQEAGLFQAPPTGTSLEEEAQRADVGFTDLVKRPSTGESDISRAEQAHGRSELIAHLAARSVPLVVCVFRHPANAIMGGTSDVGFQKRSTPWGGHLFRMPGPFENADVAIAHMSTLAEFLGRPSKA
ncbi:MULTISPECIES: uracil-DNA glycosylase family protein [unclassified Pseudoclavibacter]|uniref:uracil-DNA glycosylase family protein n=1 Tax=unclassified Pseudoclavibacter TaxID=2615177 RepID=UPI0027DBFB37|nr:uracil-DNA glycosylase family protein [Pseudoclavibacter sp. Marseille-Q4354]